MPIAIICRAELCVYSPISLTLTLSGQDSSFLMLVTIPTMQFFIGIHPLACKSTLRFMFTAILLFCCSFATTSLAPKMIVIKVFLYLQLYGFKLETDLPFS
jgi:hypothetical protein